MGYGGGDSGVGMIIIACAVIAAGFKAIMASRHHNTWDPMVAKMSLGGGIVAMLFGIWLLYHTIRWEMLMSG